MRVEIMWIKDTDMERKNSIKGSWELIIDKNSIGHFPNMKEVKKTLKECVE